MRKTLKYFTLMLLVVVVFTLAGCDKKKNPTTSFKNPKDITISKSKANVTLTYDDDGNYEVIEVEPYDKVFKNSKKKIRFDFMFGSQTIKEQKKSKEYAKKDSRLLVIDNIELNGYKGYVSINKKYATSDIYLYLNEEENVVVNIRVSGIMTSEVEEELKTKKPENVIYNRKDVQQILKTITYEN